jgi:hypothetical protein
MNAVDVPTAHSMDSQWFAVDQQGHVAVFDTGEGGPLPESPGQTRETSGQALQELMTFLQARRGPEPEPPPRRRRRWDPFGEYVSLGLFHYWYGDESELPLGAFFLDLYRRRQGPADPVHVEELPPQLRRLCKQISFNLAFSGVDRIQPVEFLSCSFYYDPPAYLCSDGRTVKVLPGMETEVADLWKKLPRKYREAFNAYEIEGIPTASPAPPKAARAKRKKPKGR